MSVSSVVIQPASSETICRAVISAGANGFLLFLDKREVDDALLFFKLEFPRFTAVQIKHRHLADNDAAIVVRPNQEKENCNERDAVQMPIHDVRWQKVKWHLSFALLDQLLLTHRRIVMQFDQQYAMHAYKHFDSLEWYARGLRGSNVGAFFKAEDRFDINNVYDELSKIKTLGIDIYDFRNWTVEKVPSPSWWSRISSVFTQ